MEAIRPARPRTKLDRVQEGRVWKALVDVGKTRLPWSKLQHPNRFLVPSLPFLILHYTAFIAICVFASGVLWGCATPARSLTYGNAFFLAVSAMTQAGLSPLNISTLNSFQQAVLFWLMLIGSAILASSAIIQIRLRKFEKGIKNLAKRRQRELAHLRVLAGIQRQTPCSEHSSKFDLSTSKSKISKPLLKEGMGISMPETSLWDRDDVYANSESNLTSREPMDTDSHSDLSPLVSMSEDRAKMVHHTTAETEQVLQDMEENVFPLTRAQYRELGGIEYEALQLLAWLVPVYLVLFQLLGCIGCGAWMQWNKADEALQNGLNPFWAGAFFAVSAFNNNGMSALDKNAVVLQESYYMLLTLSLLILAGNTCFPPFLRLIIWTMKLVISKCSSSESWLHYQNVLDFTLKHPRRVYTLLFPSEATWWLVLSLIILNGIDWFAFEVLNIHNPLLESIPPKYRALDGLFQAFAVRKGGFYVVTISQLAPGTLVLYVFMMFMNALPVNLAMLNTNVYEEQPVAVTTTEFLTRSPDESHERQPLRRLESYRGSMTTFGTFEDTELNCRWGLRPSRQNSFVSGADSTRSTKKSRTSFVRHQVQQQLTQDLWWLALAVFVITIIETASIRADPENFSIFNIVFEVVSAFGTVGVSVGVPNQNYSFCGAWHVSSRLVLCAVMLRGRHVGIPIAIDRAIMLPSHSIAWAKADDVTWKHTLIAPLVPPGRRSAGARVEDKLVASSSRHEP